MKDFLKLGLAAQLPATDASAAGALSCQPATATASTPAPSPSPAKTDTYLFTSESVSGGHPDKVADQISDAILDQFLAEDPESHVACETLVTTGQVIIAGEVSSKAYVDVDSIARQTIATCGYTGEAAGFDADSVGILTALHEQSPDIDRGVSRTVPEEQGAGDQGMMFGYATDETPIFMPLPLALSHAFMKELTALRHAPQLGFNYEGPRLLPGSSPKNPQYGAVKQSYLLPDAKSQVTVEYDAATNKPLRVHTVVISTQHKEWIPLANVGGSSEAERQREVDEEMLAAIRKDVKDILLPRVIERLPEELRGLFDDNLILLVNPTGKFVVGGPAGDTGLTGRKIVVDTYGGRAAHGGGAFSGKDPSKVDRSAAYAARHIAKNLVAAGVASEVLVQVAYAIGVAKPVSLYVNTRSTAKVPLTDAEISEKVSEIFDMTPRGIEERLKLRNPIYRETASFGHVGRTPRTVTKTFLTSEGKPIEREVELFTWEKLDYVDAVKTAFNL